VTQNTFHFEGKSKNVKIQGKDVAAYVLNPHTGSGCTVFINLVLDGWKSTALSHSAFTVGERATLDCI